MRLWQPSLLPRWMTSRWMADRSSLSGKARGGWPLHTCCVMLLVVGLLRVRIVQLHCYWKPFWVQLSPITTNIQTYVPVPGFEGIFIFVSMNICVTQLCAASEAWNRVSWLTWKRKKNANNNGTVERKKHAEEKHCSQCAWAYLIINRTVWRRLSKVSFYYILFSQK